MKQGTFGECTNCKRDNNCCESFHKINAPVLNSEEINEIGKVHSDFYDKTQENLYSLKIIENRCIFYKSGKCSIYNIRPMDCRLYPFDIIKRENKYYLILYKLKCINNQKFLDNISEIDSIVEKIKPWIMEFTNENNYTKMKGIEYLIIKEIRV